MGALQPGLVNPGPAVGVAARGAGITDAGYNQPPGYNMSDSISPCHGHSVALATNPARTGFSFT